MTRVLRTFLLASLVALPALSTAYGDRAWALSQRQSLRLNPEATVHYKEAIARFDKIDDRGGLRALAAAADAQPDLVALQLITATTARRMAEVGTGAESVEAYAIADAALTRLEGMNDLVSADSATVAKERALVDAARSGVSERDQKRLETGFALVTKIRKDRLERMGREDEGAANIAAGEEAAEAALPENTFDARRGRVWPQFAAPGIYVPKLIPTLQGGFGGEAGFGGGGVNPFGPGGGFAGGDPFAASGGGFAGGDPLGQGGFGGAPTDPFGAQPGAFGGDPFAVGGASGLADPFATGGAAFGGVADPFGGGGAADPFAAGALPANNFGAK